MSSFTISSHTANVVYHPQLFHSRLSKEFFKLYICQGEVPSVVSASVTASSEQGRCTIVIDFHVDEGLVDYDALLGSDWSTACNKADRAFLIDAAPVIEKDTTMIMKQELDTSLCSPSSSMGPGFGLASCMERVLCAPELLRMIFNLLDQASNAVNAQVCQQWCNLALDILWENVDNPYFLFKILAPLEKEVDSGHYEFQRLPSSSDWKRFLKYHTKVRSLSFRTISPQPLLPSVLETIAATRTTLNILPNLHTLVLEVEESIFRNLCVIFMHANIRNFTFTLSSNLEYQSLRFVFGEIHSRMPDLTDIIILSSIPMRVIETEMISLIAPLLKLKKIDLPRFYLTTKFTEALSRLPNLTNIRLLREEFGHGDPIDVRPFAPQLTHDAFPSLWRHSMTTSFHDATHFFQKNFFSLNNLRRLYIESNINETLSFTHSLLAAISENCQQLNTIYLISYPSRRFPVDQSGGLTIDVLKPLLKLSRLVYVELVHQHPLALNQEDMELLASSWPLLRTLELNYCPIYHTTPSSLTLDALIPFAKYCPELKSLCLFVDANEELVPPVDLIPFQNLKCLNMGVSSIIKTEPVALYLSGILPPTCQLFFRNTARWKYLPDIIPIHISTEVREKRDVWSKVADLLPTLWNARIHERERSRYLCRKDSKLE